MITRIFSLVVSIVLTLLIGACSKPNTKAVTNIPQAVDQKSVKSLLIAKNASEQDACSAEIANQGGKILYRGPNGLILTDKPASHFKLKNCKATLTDNAPIAPPPQTSKDTTLPMNAVLGLIPAEEMGARTFVKQHPTADGRGILIALLDTGVETDTGIEPTAGASSGHPVLAITTTGAPKILDVEDFSGEGNVALADVTVDSSGTFKGSDGTVYTGKTIQGTHFRFGVFKGSSLTASGAGTKDQFSDVGVLLYQNSGGDWRGRIDTNADKIFDGEKELYSFKESRLFTKLGVHRTLTVALNIPKDGSQASLFFDDGAHGTHVSGIAAGYDPNGLQGVAPGAQIILGKIGDNRLAGGSTTTASMLLAIDFAVRSKADIINMSYGNNPGSNLGRTPIELYVDKVAKANGILFSISAGNEGPGLHTVGVPAGADLAITNAAYLSPQTAADNLGWKGMEEGSTWFFSSVGPRLDGGWEPKLMAPGTALSSVPIWAGDYDNYEGTSMASPETTGGLALLLSAARQNGLLTDRASITRAVYDSAKPIPSLSLIEQGHGLFHIPAAFEKLKARKNPASDYVVSVTGPGNSKGKGILIRSRELPDNFFNATVAPLSDVKGDLKVLKLVPSANWIVVPADRWTNAAPQTFQIRLNPAMLTKPGLYSEKITGVDAASDDVEFEIPVTVIVPSLLNDANRHTLAANDSLKVGKIARYFVDAPVGTTALEINFSTNGPVLWAQLVDPVGNTVTSIKSGETTEPMDPLRAHANIKRAGVYEVDIVSGANATRPANYSLNVRAYSLTSTLGPPQADKRLSVTVQNNFEAVKVIPRVIFRSVQSKKTLNIQGVGTKVTLPFTGDDQNQFSHFGLQFDTALEYYDLMTDYPYRVFDASGNEVTSGGLMLDTTVDLPDLRKLPIGDLTLNVAGSFAEQAPANWSVAFSEKRYLVDPQVLYTGSLTLLEDDQTMQVPVDLSSLDGPFKTGYENCLTLYLDDFGGSVVQEREMCLKN
jgi:tripeptidyl-peptidase II